jgi:hypothetical protein
VKGRTSIEFFDDEDGIDKWKSGDGKGVMGNCYIYKNNVFDDIIDLIEDLIELHDGTKYIIIIDCMDALNLQEDLDKAKANRKKRKEGKPTESFKVAGAPLITKLFFKRMSLSMTELGHMTILISQVSTPIDIKYSSGPPRKVSGTGGNAAMHFANWIFDFQPRFKGDLILADPSKNSDPEDNPIIGHWVKVIIRKSDNEKSENMYRYPIRYGMTGGNSIWRSYEVVDTLLSFGIIVRRASWFNFTDYALEKMDTANIDPPFKKIQGLDKIRFIFDEREDACDFWYKYIYDNMTSSALDSLVEIPDEDDEIL